MKTRTLCSDKTYNMKSWNHSSAALLLGLCIIVAVSSAQPILYELKPEYDICNPKTEVENPNSVYLQYPGNSTEVYVNWAYNSNKSSSIDCLMYFKTCENCRIKVEPATNFEYPYSYVFDSVPAEYVTTCIKNTAYFALFDADYKVQTARIVSSYANLTSYQSESRQLYVIACGVNYKQDIRMRLRLTSMEKVQNISLSDQSSSYYFTSPYFPSLYAKNSEIYTFKIQAVYARRYIVVSFTDWMLTSTSYLKFDGAKDVDIVSGDLLRPVIVSTGQSLNVTFYTGEIVALSSNYLGFRAEVRSYDEYQYVPIPAVDCDSIITSVGGFIRLTGGWDKDCIWVIRKMAEYDGVYLKVTKNEARYTNTRYTSDYSFEIHDGITSVDNFMWNIQQNDPIDNNSVLYSRSGFYIRLKGSSSASETSHVLSYAMYKYGCDDLRGYFQCAMGLCISSNLKCDGYEHCEDGGDESPSICGTSFQTTHSSNNYPISIGVIIPLVVSVFLIIVMCVLIIFIRRCRRINNTARSMRPPAIHQPQNRRQRRRNRDVQMSVTLSSGEHPPSYDEVLQSTPIGYLNMAFTWSQHGNILTQPPSYEEAVSPSSQQNGSIIISATTNNGVCHGETNLNPQIQNSSTVLTTTISASLDPRADVSSSSSSEDTTDHYHQLDISSSSDSSTENEHSLIPSNNLEHSRSITNLSKVSKDSDSGVISQIGVPKYGGGTEGIQVMLDSPISKKVNAAGHGDVKPENSHRKEESKNNKNLNVDGGRNQRNENERDMHRGFADVKNAADDRCSHSPHSSDRRHEGRRNEVDNHGFSRREDSGVSERDKRPGGEKCNVYRKHKEKYSDRSVDREGTQLKGQGGYSRRSHDGLNIEPPRVTDSSRSQSCVDLSSGAGRLLDTDRTRMRDEDKRFSYAGAGDVSLTRGSLDPFYNGRSLVREKPVEHLDKYASQSYDNLRDGYSARRHCNRDYETVSGQDEHVHKKYGHSPDLPAYVPRSKRDNSDLLRSDAQYSSLAPVQEYTYGEIEDAPGSKSSEEIDTVAQLKNDTSKDNNKWSKMPQYKTPESVAGFNQAQPKFPQEASSHKARNPSAVHLPSGPKGSWPSDTVALTPGPQNVYKEDQRKPSQNQTRRQAEPASRTHNFINPSDSQNLNPSSSRNFAYSDIPDGIGNSKNNSFDSDHKKILQSDQVREASENKPKPSLRTHFQAPQRPVRDVSDTMPQHSPQSHFQAAQRPTPAPRNGIKKRHDANASRSDSVPSNDQHPDRASYSGPTQQRLHSGTQYPDQTFPTSSSAQQMNPSGQPRPDTQRMRESPDTNRQTSNKQNGRGNESSACPVEQTSSRGQINIQTTKDDVFV